MKIENLDEVMELRANIEARQNFIAAVSEINVFKHDVDGKQLRANDFISPSELHAVINRILRDQIDHYKKQLSDLGVIA